MVVLALRPEPRPKARNLPTCHWRARRRSLGKQDSTCRASVRAWSLSDERLEGPGRTFSLRPAQLPNELKAACHDVKRHRLFEEQPAEPLHHGTFCPWIALLGVEHDEPERLLK